MNPIIAESFRDAFLEARDFFGTPVTIDGAVVVCIADSHEYQKLWNEGGYGEDGDVTVRYMLSDLPVAPPVGTKAEYEGIPMRIQSVTKRPGAYIGALTLRPVRR